MTARAEGERSPRARRRAALLAVLLLAAPAAARDALAPPDAIRHVGEAATVCGTVSSATYARRTKGEPTFLNLGRPYPVHDFTALVWGEHRGAFAEPPERLEGRRICVTGTVSEYRGKAQIVVTAPAQIVVVKE